MLVSELHGRGRGEALEVGGAKRLLDCGDLSDGVFKAVFPELPMLDFFELLAHLVELMGRERLPCGKHNVSSRAEMQSSYISSINSERARKRLCFRRRDTTLATAART